MEQNILLEIQKRIYEFFHPSVESIMKKFAIVEDLYITEEEKKELLKILDKWEVIVESEKYRNLTDGAEAALDEADRVAEEDSRRMGNDEVFESLRRILSL